MHLRKIHHCVVAIIVLGLDLNGLAQTNTDTRATTLKTVNTTRDFPKISSKAEWETRAKNIREQILVSCGLWPMPERTPIRAHIFGKIIREGYTIEKVYFQTYPGFYLAGNLYRPTGQGKGSFPGVLNPHGHWDYGRMADYKEGSIAARCISFARQGMVAFSYDMVGYNDTFFPDQELPKSSSFYDRHRRFATNEVNMLWNISLMGLQTWNSIRALDFLESLPDVDKSRLACTGESGGGTQTYLLGAIDNRLAAQAPVVMVSHTMQGGCSCENVFGLRIDHSNVEISAVAAPRPQIIVGATGDWTKATMQMEGPSVESVYRLLGVEDKLHYVVFDFRHNYNQTSREAVYDFFAKWLHPPSPISNEAPYSKEPDLALRVFPDGKLPDDAVAETTFIDSLIATYRQQLDELKPKDKKSFNHCKEILLPAWRHTMQVEIPKEKLWTQNVYIKTMTNCIAEKLSIGRTERGDRISAMVFSPSEKWRGKMVILAHPNGIAPYLDQEGRPTGLAKMLLGKKAAVLLLDTFLTGDSANYELSSQRNQVELFFTTYNRTDLQERVQDLITAASYAKNKRKNSEVILCGTGRAGLWAMLAAPAVDGIVADCNGLDTTSDRELLKPDLFVPGLRKIGSFQGVVSLAAPNPTLLYNANENFSLDWLRNTYSAVKASKALRVETHPLEEATLAERIAELK